MATPIYALAEMRDQILNAGRAPEDTTLQGYVDAWLNEEMMDVTDRLDFPELFTRWQIPLTTTAPTPHTWAPYEITTVPSDMVKLIEAHLLTTDATNQRLLKLDIVPNFEMHRQIGVVNPPTTGSPPRKVCIRRVEGARESGYSPLTGTAGIRVKSSAAEAATIEVSATYYDDTNRLKPVKKVLSTLTTSYQSLTSDTLYGIKAIGKSAATAGVLTLQNTAGTIEYATILPWERSPFFMVLGFDLLPGAAYPFHCTYKRRPEYLSNPSDTMQPLPGSVQAYIMSRAKVRLLKYREDPDWQNEEAEAQRQWQGIVSAYNFQTLDEARVELW